MRSNIIDVHVLIQHETEKAVLVRGDEEADPVWLPKSQIELESLGAGLGIVTLPEWLAQERGLI